MRLVQEALGPERRHEAIYTTMQFAPGYEFNIFDLQVGCEYPLPLEKAFLQNFLALDRRCRRIRARLSRA